MGSYLKHSAYQIILPKPPSTNCLYSTDWRTKRRFKSQRYKAWIAEAEVALHTQKREEFKGEVVVKISVGKQDKRKADVSNYCKATEDFLVSQGIIEDDSLVQCLTIWWDRTISGCVVSIGKADE